MNSTNTEWHQYPVLGNGGKRRPTAAMMAGVTDRLWTFDDLYDAVMG